MHSASLLPIVGNPVHVSAPARADAAEQKCHAAVERRVKIAVADAPDDAPDTGGLPGEKAEKAGVVHPAAQGIRSAQQPREAKKRGNRTAAQGKLRDLNAKLGEQGLIVVRLPEGNDALPLPVPVLEHLIEHRLRAALAETGNQMDNLFPHLRDFPGTMRWPRRCRAGSPSRDRSQAARGPWRYPRWSA